MERERSQGYCVSQSKDETVWETQKGNSKKDFHETDWIKLTTELNDTDVFFVDAPDKLEEVSDVELLIDSACTCHMIEDIE